MISWCSPKVDKQARNISQWLIGFETAKCSTCLMTVSFYHKVFLSRETVLCFFSFFCKRLGFFTLIKSWIVHFLQEVNKKGSFRNKGNFLFKSHQNDVTHSGNTHFHLVETNKPLYIVFHVTLSSMTGVLLLTAQRLDVRCALLSF